MTLFDRLYQASPVSLQTLLLNLKAVELYGERYGRKFWRLLEEFEQNQWRSDEQMEAYQTAKLQLVIANAYENVPYYRALMTRLKLRPVDIKTKEDLSKLPILTRADVKKHSADLLARNYPKIFLRHGHTSGTTGSPLDFSYDISTCVLHHVADWRQKHWAGLRWGEPYASLQGRVITPTTQQQPPFWRYNYVNRQLFLSSFHLHMQNLPHYFAELERRNIRVIEGYPSTLYILALYLLKTKQTYRLRAALTSSETLFDYQREAIESAFGCKVFDFYGMAERVVYASECAEHCGHHLNSDYGVTEFLDRHHEPVRPGQWGKIVATGLHNFAMPFLRYETNDVCALKTRKCACGRVFPLIEDIATKDESIVTLPDGRLISPSVLTHPFKPMHNIVESQIVQEEINELVIHIVRGARYTRSDEAQLLAAFHERLGGQMKIRVTYLDAIPRTTQGKLKWVVSKVPVQV